MKDVSSELWFLLLFALIFLGQYVLQRIRASRQQQRDTPGELPPGPLERNAAQWQWELPPASIGAPSVMPETSTPERRPEREHPRGVHRGDRGR